jgi:hypothetical protein
VPAAFAQVPDDAKRVSLEAKIAALQPLVCVPPAAQPDPQVATLKGVLDAYSLQYGATLDAQIKALSAHQVAGLSDDDQDVMATARTAKRAALADLCAHGLPGMGAARMQAPPPSLAEKFEILPAVVRAGEKEVSGQGEASVTFKNNSGKPVRLGVAQICFNNKDERSCSPQGEIFQVADGVDKCKNPLADNEQCTLKILFTPHRSFDYSQWLRVPFLDGAGQPLKESDGKRNAFLMVPLQGKGVVNGMAHVEATQVSANHPSLRSVVGLDMGGATATDTQQKFFVDFALNAPFWRSGYTVCTDSRGKPLTDRKGNVAEGRVLARDTFAGDIQEISRTDNIVTVKTRTPHHLAPRDHAVIMGVSDKSFKGRFEVLSQSDSTHFTYAQEGADQTSSNGRVLKSEVSADQIVRNYDDCQDLRTAEEKDNYVRFIWKDRLADPLDSRFLWYFNPRITSISQSDSALSSLNVAGFSDIFNAQKTSMVQGVDVQGGIEMMLVKPRDGRAFYGSFKNTKARLGLAWVAGAGFASPFAAPGNNPTVFTLDPKSPLRNQFQASGPQFCGAPPATSPCDIPAQFTNITFVNLERSRFFRKYYSGLRVKTYHFSKAYSSYDCNPDYQGECEGVYNAYPGLLDVTVGQDEQVTGGHLSRWVLRLDAAYPLPFLPGTYIFGGLNSAFQKNKNTDPLFLPPTSTTAISDPSVFQVKEPLRNRDNYRLGLGVDLLQVITHSKQQVNKNPGDTGKTPPQGSN